MTSKILAVSGIERLGHQIDAFSIRGLAKLRFAFGTSRTATLVISQAPVRVGVKNENRTTLFTIIGRVGRALVAVHTVQDGVAHCAGILAPVGLIHADVVCFFAGQAVVTDLHRSLYHVGIPRPHQ